MQLSQTRLALTIISLSFMLFSPMGMAQSKSVNRGVAAVPCANIAPDKSQPAELCYCDFGRVCRPEPSEMRHCTVAQCNDYRNGDANFIGGPELSTSAQEPTVELTPGPIDEPTRSCLGKKDGSQCINGDLLATCHSGACVSE